MEYKKSHWFHIPGIYRKPRIGQEYQLNPGKFIVYALTFSTCGIKLSG